MRYPTKGTRWPPRKRSATRSESVMDPEIGRPIEDIGMLKDIEVDGGTVRVDVLITDRGLPAEGPHHDRRDRGRARRSPGVERVDVSLAPMTRTQRQALVRQLRGGAPGGRPQPQPTFFPRHDDRHRRRIGQGRRRQVQRHREPRRARSPPRATASGVLDADVWGFSVPRMMGVVRASPSGSTT